MSVSKKNNQKGNPNDHDNPDLSGKPTYAVTDAVTELLRVHARHLIATALELKVNEVVNELKNAGRDVVRNGYLPELSVTTAIGDERS
jgi:phospholipase/lecithinase/hemolysin